MKMLRFLIFYDFYGTIKEVLYILLQNHMTDILSHISQSETKNENKESTHQILQQANDILYKFQNHPEYERIKKEYDDVEKSIRQAIETQNEITSDELLLIELEFNHMLRLDQWDSYVASFLNQTWRIARGVWFDSSSADFLDATKVTNQYQEDLVIKIMWQESFEKWFNEKYIVWYNNKIGNYIMMIWDFEWEFKKEKKIDGQETDQNVVNSTALANYFKYLLARYDKDTYKILSQVKEVVGSDNLKALSGIWRTSENTIAQNILRKSQFWIDLIETIKTPEKIFDLSPEWQAVAMEIGDDTFENKLFVFIEANKNDPDFQKKFLEFSTNVWWHCSLSAQAMLDKILGEIQNNGGVKRESVEVPQVEELREPFKNQLLIKIGIILEWASSSIESKPLFWDIALNNTSSTNFIWSDNPSSNESQPKVNILETIKNIQGEDELRKILRYIEKDIQPNISDCPYVEWVWLEKIYQEAHETLLKIMEKKLQDSIQNLLLHKLYPGKSYEDLSNDEKGKIDEKINQISDWLNDISCSLSWIQLIQKVFTESDVSFDTSDQNLVLGLLEQSTEIQFTQVNGEIALAQLNGEEVSPETQKKLEQIQTQRENLILLQKMDPGDFQTLLLDLKSGKDPQSLMREIRFQEEKRELWIYDNTITYPSWAEVWYYQVWNNYEIPSANWLFRISSSEFRLIANNEKALENIINFKTTLDELRLDGLWKYREGIFRALGNIHTLQFDTTDDYINPTELKIFLNGVIWSLWYPSYETKTLQEMKQDIMVNNIGANPLTQNSQVAISWNSRLEQEFLNKFDPKRDGNFLQNKFEQALQNKIT